MGDREKYQKYKVGDNRGRDGTSATRARHDQ